MKKPICIRLCVLLFVLLIFPAFGAEVTVLAPSVLTPSQSGARFTVPAAGTATLTMVNGAGTQELVTNGSVFLNDQQVIGREDFDLEQIVVQNTVTLREGENKLFFRNMGVQRNGRIRVEIAAAADRIELAPISDAIVAGEENLAAEATVSALGLPVEDADLLFEVDDLGGIPAVESQTDEHGVATATLSGFVTAGMGTLKVTVVGSDPALAATTPFEVVLVAAIDLDQGLTELALETGTIRHLGYGIDVNETGGQSQQVTFTQTLDPNNGGVTLTSDYPGGWTTASPQTFLVNQVITGVVPGSYVLTSTATITGTGESRSRQLHIEVVDSLAGVLELNRPGSEPPALRTNEPMEMVFTVLASGADDFPTSLVLEEVDSAGTVLSTLGDLFDDGNGDDWVAGDRVYTGTFQLAGAAEGARHFRAVGFDGGASVSSESYHLLVTRFPVSTSPPDPKTWVEDPTTGETMPSNEILVGFVEGLSPDQIEAMVAAEGASIVGFLPSLGVFQIRIDGDGTTAGVQAAIEAFEAHTEVEFAEANGVGNVGAVPPDSSQQWGAVKIRADETWVAARSSVLVAVVDTGVDYNHPDLSGQVAMGKDFVNNDNDPLDDHSHGTHVAGIIGAKHNGSGVSGIAHGSMILAVKAASAQGSVTWSDLASGVRYAADQGAKVINVSLWFTAPGSVGKTAVEYASKKGSLVVGIAGNHGASTKTYPGAYSDVLCVGNTTQSDGRNSSSGFGSWVDIAAPGTSIYSTVLNNGYGNKTGTSMAAPHVAGAAAVLWSQHSSWSASQVRERLEKTAKNLSASLNLGAGRLDLFEAVFNGSFEIGDLAEWTSTGTCSSLKKLGPTALDPRHESRMGYCSTGPAGDQVAANLRKTFTVQSGVTSLPIRFEYNFVSEEFPEFVGTQFNDALEITLTSPSGVETVLAMETINSSAYTMIGGVDFPGGDNTMGHTGWKVATATVPVAAGDWTLEINISDAGDDIYDSVVLIDHIRLK